MANVNFVQVDTAPGCIAAAFCTGRGLSTTRASMRADKDASAGSGTDTAVLGLGETNKVFASIELPMPAGYTGTEAGTVPVKFKYKWETGFGVPNNLTEVYICRVNSGCTSLSTIGSATGLSVSLSQTTYTVVTQNVTISAVSLDATDKILIVLVGTCADGDGGQELTFLSDQTIVVPMAAAAADVTASPGTGALDLTGFAPTFSGVQTVNPGVGALTLTGFAPTVNINPARVQLEERGVNIGIGLGL